MQYPCYKITIGSITIDSIADPTSSTVISLEIELDMNVSADTFNIVLAQINGLKINNGDSCKVELGYKDNLIQIIEGTVEAVESTIGLVEVKGFNAISKLLNLRINQIYESQTAGAIMADLSSQAGVSIGEKEDGITLPFYVIDATRNGYEHIQDLSIKCGFDVYLTPDSKLTFKGFQKTAGDYTVEYAKDIINLEMTNHAEERQVIVYGESPASSQGDETSHWLVKSFEDYKGTAGSEAKYEIVDPTIRTKDAAATYAKAVVEDMKKNTINGSLTILGNAEIKLGDAVEVKGMPDTNMNGVFQVRKIQHLLSKEIGFISKIGYRGLE
ncbi:MAG: hypothetical protein V1749_07205 [Candidatus Desantisbacteria bacterium]